MRLHAAAPATAPSNWGPFRVLGSGAFVLIGVLTIVVQLQFRSFRRQANSYMELASARSGSAPSALAMYSVTGEQVLDRPAVAAPGVTHVGWIGTGVMGAAMAGHVLDAGYSVTCYNRSTDKSRPVIAKGASVAQSPREVAAQSDIVFVMVGYPSDVREVILHPETGALAGLRPGGMIVDMTTSDPALAMEIYTTAKLQGKYSLDTPVTGGDRGAKAGTLTIFVGGDEADLAFCRPILETFGSTISHAGSPGMGQHCKAANQITIATTMIGMCEGMLYAHSVGLDVEQYLKAIAGGSAGSRSIDLYSDRILQRDMEPGFYVEHFVKDLGLALNAAQAMQLSLPGLALAQQLYLSLMANGHGKCGTQALIMALEQMNNTRLPTITSSEPSETD
jgi:3-hydroxyisobutyrate dehydrogenase-like beta-hydroxyacid dehydrogenase